MSDQTDLKIAEAYVSNAYLFAISLAVGVAFGAAWALIPLLVGLVVFLAA
jgi:hypothetical protein